MGGKVRRKQDGRVGADSWEDKRDDTAELHNNHNRNIHKTKQKKTRQ